MKIIVVDQNDQPIGLKNREDLTLNDIYRVSALWITNSKKEILLAKRHPSKKHHPNLWGPAVAGTVDEGENYEDNIIKEAEEELGLKNITLTPGPKSKSQDQYQRFTQWYTLTIDQPAEDFVLEENEVSEVKWFSPLELKTKLKNNPEKFLPNLKKYFNLFS